MEVTLQCDASNGGLGYTLLQQGELVVFGTRGLISRKEVCTDWERDVVACGCEKFDQYVYIREQGDSGNRPQTIGEHFSETYSQHTKATATYASPASKVWSTHHLQKRVEMYLADALSRAYPEDLVPSSIPQPQFCHVVKQLELAEHLPILTKQLKQIQEATIADHNLQVLQETILTG